MRIVFMGTPDFAVPCLEGLVRAGHDVVGVFTQPDKAKGRGYSLTAPPVKKTAEKYGIPVYQPSTLRSDKVLDTLQALNPELIAVVAYGKILPQAVLAVPPLGCVNVHGSLLPRYRGAAPIQWAVINGEEVTGVTTMRMDEGMDTGDVLMQARVAIDPTETAGELFDRLCHTGAELLLQTLSGLSAGTITPKKQDERAASYAPMLDKSLSTVDWSAPADKIHNLVRGLNPWPVATTRLRGRNLRIFLTAVESGPCVERGTPGQVLSVEPFFVVQCGKGTSLRILELQMESKNRMKSEDFLHGYQLNPGEILG